MTITGSIPTLPPAGGVLAPVRPGDDLSFEELAAGYNFRNTSVAKLVFARLLIKEALKRPGPVRVLDIGCGHGLGRQPEFTRAMRPYFGQLWGVEPDAGVHPPEGLFDRVLHATLEEADLPAATFDIAYSFMVMEHVTNPGAFMAAVARALRPGGVYMFVTPNGGHYFTIIAGALNRIGLDEAVLSLIKGAKKEQYHYPVAYRLNTPRQIADACAGTGLGPPQCAYLEVRGPAGYMGGVLRPLYWLLAWKRRFIRRPEALLTMVGRVGKDEPGELRRDLDQGTRA